MIGPHQSRCFENSWFSLLSNNLKQHSRIFKETMLSTILSLLLHYCTTTCVLWLHYTTTSDNWWKLRLWCTSRYMGKLSDQSISGRAWIKCVLKIFKINISPYYCPNFKFRYRVGTDTLKMIQNNSKRFKMFQNDLVLSLTNPIYFTREHLRARLMR